MSLIRLCFLILSAALALCSGAASAELYARFEGDRALVIISDTPPDDPRYLLYKKDRLGDIDPITEQKNDAPAGEEELAPSKFNGHILAAAKETKVDVALIRAV